MEFGNKIGAWSFIAGLVIALIFAFIPSADWMVWLLGVLGVIIGLLNIGDTEVKEFLIAAIAFVVSASSLVSVFGAFAFIGQFFGNIITLIGPAAAIVAIKALYNLAKD